MGDAQVGAEATVCTVKGVTGYSVGMQTKIDDITAAVILARRMQARESS
jgi:hypothetical protein